MFTAADWRRCDRIVRTDLLLQVYVTYFQICCLRFVTAGARLSGELVLTMRNHYLLRRIASICELVFADRDGWVLCARRNNVVSFFACWWSLNRRSLVVNLVHVSHEVVYGGIYFIICWDSCIRILRGRLLLIEMRSCLRVEPLFVFQNLPKDIFTIANWFIHFYNFILCGLFLTLNLVLNMIVIFLL